MKRPFDARAPAFSASAINDTIQRALASAGLDTSTGPMHDVTEVIRRALAAGGITEPDAAPVGDRTAETTPPPRGSFQSHEFRNAAGTRAYKVYVPADAAPGPRMMLVMLHGCTQSADDFAAGTRMNRLADEHGWVVVYPEQAAQANPQKCWNWFKPEDQRRDAGEPSLIAGIVREVASTHDVDVHRIFVAGLSAGAAMAVVLGATYPELFAGVGAHSGLPFGSAQDIPSALAAMKGGRGQSPATRSVQPVPVIVFHGDRDHTVQSSNGTQIVAQALQAYRERSAGHDMSVITEEGVSAGGRHFTRTVHSDAAGQARVEHWSVQGAGHAWSGGDASGSFTDGSGPDASAAMLRFFMSLPQAGSA
jgi:poly(hydroxyalkanoate) depolymerase family esterase